MSSKYSHGFDFVNIPAVSGRILNSALNNVSESTEIVYEHISVNGDFTIQAKLGGDTLWTDIYSATGTASGSIDISKYDDIRVIADTNITAGKLIISAFSFSVLNVNTIVNSGSATSANQNTSNVLLNQIELNQDTQTALLNTIASNTSSTPSADITLVDTTSTPNIVYVGEASPGSSQASAVWKITRIDTSGPVIAILYADGNTNKDNIWNNRISGSYS